MSIQPNVIINGAFYHVCSRGFNRQTIFINEDDYGYFLKLLQKSFVKFDFSIHSYCLLPNHYHIFLQTFSTPLSQIMKFLNESYAKFFIKKYRDHDGYVFSRRYRRHLVQDTIYSKTLFAYVNFNAVKHKLVQDPTAWSYSSYHELMRPQKAASFLSYKHFETTFNGQKNFDEFARTQFDINWSPEEYAVGKFILGDSDFIEKHRDEYIDCGNENLLGRWQLFKSLDSQKILTYTKNLTVDSKLKSDIEIFLLREYTNLTRSEISQLYGIQTNTISKRVGKIKKTLEANNSLKELLAAKNIIKFLEDAQGIS